MTTLSVRLAGITFRPIEAQVRASKLEDGDELILTPEPTNQYDPDAVKVFDLKTDLFLGYIPRRHSKKVVALIESGEPYDVTASGPYWLTIESDWTADVSPVREV